MLSAWEAWPSFSWPFYVSSSWGLFVSGFLCNEHPWLVHRQLHHPPCPSKVKNRYRLQCQGYRALSLGLSPQEEFHRRGHERQCDEVVQIFKAPHFPVGRSAPPRVVLGSDCTQSTIPCRFSSCLSKTSFFASKLPYFTVQGVSERGHWRQYVNEGQFFKTLVTSWLAFCL